MSLHTYVCKLISGTLIPGHVLTNYKLLYCKPKYFSGQNITVNIEILAMSYYSGFFQTSDILNNSVYNF